MIRISRDFSRFRFALRHHRCVETFCRYWAGYASISRYFTGTTYLRGQRTFNYLYMHFFRTGKTQFADDTFLLQAIRKGDSKAILFLQDKSAGFTIQLLQQKQLPRHLSGEVLNDACIVLLKKVREPDFVLQSAKLSTYFLEIVKYVVLNKTRGRQYAGNTSIDDQEHLQDHTVEEYFQQKEHIELINQLFNNVGPPCADIIRLKYLDGYADEEVVAQRLSAYSTVESLRVKRSDCMKKLKEMVRNNPDK